MQLSATPIVALALVAHAISLASSEPLKIDAAAKCTKAPQQDGTSCDLHGYHYSLMTVPMGKYYTAYLLGEPVVVSAVEDCAYLCARRAASDANRQEISSNCGSFEFDPEHGLCQLLSANVADIFNPDDKSHKPRVYNDLGCYNCGDLFCNTPEGQPYGHQLLDNPGFETDFLGPWKISYVDVYKSRKNGTKIVISNLHPHVYVVEQVFNHCLGEYYDISFDYTYDFPGKSNATYMFPSLVVESLAVDDYTWGVGFGASSRTNGMHRRGRYIYQDPIGGGESNYLADVISYNKYVASGLVDHGLVFTIDNVLVFRRPPPVPVAGTMSRISNGGFEAASFAPWNITTNRAAVKPHYIKPGLHGSSRALKIRFSGILGMQYLTYTLSQEILATKPNTMYIMSADFSVRGLRKKVNDPDYFLSVLFYMVSGGTVNIRSFPRFQPDENRTITLPMHVAGHSATFVIYVEKPYGAATLVVDNISMFEMSEHF